jgi:hypothetical protein
MIAAITPTGSRPNQFNLCSRWMQRQTYKGEVTWFIVEDCHPRTTDFITDDFKENWTIVKIYPTPLWHGENTQARNISNGIYELFKKYKQSEIEAIFIIEDDDWYRATYLEEMMNHKSTFDLWGESNTIYYNVYYRRYAANNNFAHASLFQTAFSPKVFREFEDCYSQKFIDFVFWAKIANRNLFSAGNLAVGMKGMPGRGGIGAGHSRAFTMLVDQNCQYLGSLIGVDDAKLYQDFYVDKERIDRINFRKR